MTNAGKADIHIHTTFSDGLNEPEDIVNYVVANTDLSVIAITDHNTIDGARAAYDYWRKHHAAFSRLEVIKGIEVSSSDGHILALFVEEDIPRNMSPADTVDAIHEQGGLAIAAHPFTHLLPFTDIRGLGRLIAYLPLDGVEVRNSFPTEIYANWITAVYNQHHSQYAALGSSDAHYLTMIGKAYTFFPGQTAWDFRQAVENKRVKAGGQVFGLVPVWQAINYLIRRSQLPVVRPKDRHHRHKGFGLTIDVTEEHWGPLSTVCCAGDLVVGNSDMLENQGRQLLSAGQTHLILDLTALQFMDSSGSGSLIALQRAAHRVGGDLLLAGLNKEVALSLQLARLDKYFRIFNSVEAALTTFSQSSPVIAGQQVLTG